jgi:uncharacterized glyoxalase superfamily metalloenzyme YdcJ
MGMYPVGYYDLSTSGVPVHATAFRPIAHASLSVNPFRVFTSLLRPELISDRHLRQEVSAILGKRNIFHPLVPSLIEKAENQGGLERKDATDLVTFALETFKWHERSLVCQKTYAKMRACHPLLADIAGFKGPHINHLTPRVLDIDAAQKGMEARGYVLHHTCVKVGAQADKGGSRPNRSSKARLTASAPSSCAKPRSKP